MPILTYINLAIKNEGWPSLGCHPSYFVFRNSLLQFILIPVALIQLLLFVIEAHFTALDKSM